MSRAAPMPARSSGERLFVAVDWGSTRLRLRLLSAPAAAGGPLAEETSRQGIGAVAAGEHQRIFLHSLDALLAPPGRREAFLASGGDVYFAGMVTSTLGWIPTPYLRVPCGAADLAAARRTEEIGPLRLHFLPGVRTADDVMRGEEVEAIGILGADSAGPAILVLPGTHSKWIHWSGGRITGFTTVPTGDLHAGLHRATLLARTLPAEPAAVENALLLAFDRGADLARDEGPLASLFKARSLPVLEGLAPEAASALLSGVLIAGEALERTRGGLSQRLLVAGAPALAALYLRALVRLGISAERVPPELAERASARGLEIVWSGAEGPPRSPEPS